MGIKLLWNLAMPWMWGSKRGENNDNHKMLVVRRTTSKALRTINTPRVWQQIKMVGEMEIKRINAQTNGQIWTGAKYCVYLRSHNWTYLRMAARGTEWTEVTKKNGMGKLYAYIHYYPHTNTHISFRCDRDLTHFYIYIYFWANNLVIFICT